MYDKLKKKERDKKWNQANKDKVAIHFKKYWDKNKDNKNKKRREYYASNPEKFREKTKQWQRANPEKKKAIMDKWRKDNPNYWQEFKKKYPEKSFKELLKLAKKMYKKKDSQEAEIFDDADELEGGEEKDE